MMFQKVFLLLLCFQFASLGLSKQADDETLYDEENFESLGKRDWNTAKGSVFLKGCFEVRPCGSGHNGGGQLGTKENPAASCKAIYDNDSSSPNGVYYIKTHPTVTKVYCYMKGLPGCCGGGWTTVMKIDGRKQTFKHASALWTNKNPYHVTNGQSGLDELETKLPTYWTLPFHSLCLGMRVGGQTKWIHLNYGASSLYAVIADGTDRSFTIGRNQWKSLIAGSSLQKNCNREGFNVLGRARIGFFANQENECKSPDSYVAYGAIAFYCKGKATTGNCAQSSENDNGPKTAPAIGYILAQ